MWRPKQGRQPKSNGHEKGRSNHSRVGQNKRTCRGPQTLFLFRQQPLVVTSERYPPKGKHRIHTVLGFHAQTQKKTSIQRKAPSLHTKALGSRPHANTIQCSNKNLYKGNSHAHNTKERKKERQRLRERTLSLFFVFMYSLSYSNPLKGNNDLRPKNETDKWRRYTQRTRTGITDGFKGGSLVHEKTVA